MAATRLRDYGVSLITSCERGKSEARARRELLELIRAHRSPCSDSASTASSGDRPGSSLRLVLQSFP